MNNQFRFVPELFTRLTSCITLLNVDITFPVSGSQSVLSLTVTRASYRKSVDLLMHQAMIFGSKYHQTAVIAGCHHSNRTDNHY